MDIGRPRNVHHINIKKQVLAEEPERLCPKSHSQWNSKETQTSDTYITSIPFSPHSPDFLTLTSHFYSFLPHSSDFMTLTSEITFNPEIMKSALRK